MRAAGMTTIAMIIFILTGCTSQPEETATRFKNPLYADEARLYAEVPQILPSIVIVDNDSYSNMSFPNHVIGLPKQFGIKFKTAVPLSVTFAKGKIRHFFQMPDGKIYKIESSDFGRPILSVKLPNGKIIPVQFSDVYGTSANAHPVQEVPDFSRDHGDAQFYIQGRKIDVNSCRPDEYPGVRGYSVLQYQEACFNGFQLGHVLLATAEKAAVLIIYEPPNQKGG